MSLLDVLFRPFPHFFTNLFSTPLEEMQWHTEMEVQGSSWIVRERTDAVKNGEKKEEE